MEPCFVFDVHPSNTTPAREVQYRIRRRTSHHVGLYLPSSYLPQMLQIRGKAAGKGERAVTFANSTFQHRSAAYVRTYISSTRTYIPCHAHARPEALPGNRQCRRLDEPHLAKIRQSPWGNARREQTFDRRVSTSKKIDY